VNAQVAAHATRAAHAGVGQILRLDGTDLQVTDTGPRNGRTIVLLHGWTESLHIFDDVVPLLGQRLRVVRIDLPGHGGSEAPTAGYTMPQQARQVARALDALQVRHAVLAGHSMGGVVASAIAEMRPDLVRGLVLIDSPTAVQFQKPSLIARSSIAPVTGPLIHGFAPDVIERHALGIAVAPGARVPAQLVRDLNKVPWPAYAQSYDDTVAWIRREPLPRRLSAIHTPKLVVWGARDQLVDPAAADEYRRLSRTRVVVLAAVGHTPPIEAPARVAALLTAFERTAS